MHKNNIIYILLCFLLVVEAGCASISPPNGGEVDKTSPLYVSSNPANQSVNFKGREIIIKFTEPVTTTNLQKELQITPSMDASMVRQTERENILTLSFANDLAATTTYTLDFGNSIVDITEKNVAEKVKLVFSTGFFLDTGRVHGKVTDLLKGKPVGGASVGLYSLSSDSLAFGADPQKKRATYFVKTLEDGTYNLKNVREGTYKFFSFIDLNSSKQYEEPESIAYWPKPLVVTAADTVINFQVSKLDMRAPLLTTRQESEGRLILTYNEGLRSVTVLNTKGQKSRDYTFRRDGKEPRKVVVFGSPSEKSQRIISLVQDSVGNKRVDTISTRFTSLNQIVRRGTAIMPSVEEEVEATNYEWKLEFPGRIRVTKQVFGQIIASADALNTEKIPLSKKQLRNESLVLGKNAMLDSSQSVLNLYLPANNSVASALDLRLVLDSTALVFTATPEVLVSGRPFKITSVKQARDITTGAITVTPQSNAHSYSLELVRSDNSVERRYDHWQQLGDISLSTNEKVSWGRLAAGTYHLRAFVDADGNGKWDGPDPHFERLAEPVILGTDLVVRAKWEQEVLFAF